MNATRVSAAVVVVFASIATAFAASEPPAGATSCSGCHPANAGVQSPVPPLAGRNAAEIVAQMQAFRAGQRSATVMDRIAKGFSDAEIQAIAVWYAEQH
jgi:cytochrome subunit of sulfide dehydrogenase